MLFAFSIPVFQFPEIVTAFCNCLYMYMYIWWLFICDYNTESVVSLIAYFYIWSRWFLNCIYHRICATGWCVFLKWYWADFLLLEECISLLLSFSLKVLFVQFSKMVANQFSMTNKSNISDNEGEGVLPKHICTKPSDNGKRTPFTG